jgi:DNA-binding HxlR family transcriptional regulator
VRAGAYALSLLSAPLNVHILQTLEGEPRSLMELRRAVGSPPQTTMRGHLRTLTEIGVLERLRKSDFPGSVEYELSRSGHELLEVATVLQTWLVDSPGGPVSLGSVASKSSIKAMVEGWSSTIVRALASRPLSLTDLNKLISNLNYPSIERRLGALRLAGQIEASPGLGRGTPYAVTDWLRRAVAPIAAAASWEHRHVFSVAAPVGRLDAEACLLLSVPLLSLVDHHSGFCRLAVEIGNGGGGHRVAGVMVGVEEGRISSCSSRLEGNHATAWASGSTPAWLRAVIHQDVNRLEVGGDGQLAMALLDGLHEALFRVRQEV